MFILHLAFLSDGKMGDVEHVPKCLMEQMTHHSPEQKAGKRNSALSIAKHLMTFGHQTDSKQAFQVILRKHNLGLRTLCEAPSINRLKPALGWQKFRPTMCVCLGVSQMACIKHFLEFVDAVYFSCTASSPVAVSGVTDLQTSIVIIYIYIYIYSYTYILSPGGSFR